MIYFCISISFSTYQNPKSKPICNNFWRACTDNPLYSDNLENVLQIFLFRSLTAFFPIKILDMKTSIHIIVMRYIEKKHKRKKKHIWYLQVLPTRQCIARTQWKQLKQASKTRRSRKSDPRQFQKKKTITVKFQSKGELCLKNNSNCFILRTLHKRGLTAALQI